MMHRLSLKTIVVSSLVVCLTLTAWPLSTRTSPVNPRPKFPKISIVQFPVDSLVVQADTNTAIELVKIPTFARQLDGHRVRMQGMMYPPYEMKGLKQFLFIPQTKQRPVSAKSEKLPLHALIPVSIAKGHSENVQLDPFTIEGIFKVEIRSDEGKVHFVYHIRNAKIIEKNVRLRFRPAVTILGC